MVINCFFAQQIFILNLISHFSNVTALPNRQGHGGALEVWGVPGPSTRPLRIAKSEFFSGRPIGPQITQMDTD